MLEFAVTEPNQVWCGDVTYIWTGKRWAYLAVVLDLFPLNRLAGRGGLCIDNESAIHGLGSMRKPANLLYHSDQGSHYTS